MLTRRVARVTMARQPIPCKGGTIWMPRHGCGPSPGQDTRGGVTVPLTLVLDLPDEAATAALAARLAARARRGDVIALQGPLGSGKTSFARAFIRAFAGTEEVPSPTFTLVETYAAPGKLPIWHFDLYRLTAPEQAFELGIEEAWTDAMSLIEWPERLGDLLPREHLRLTLDEGPTPHARRVRLVAAPSWADRLAGLAHG